MSEWRRVFFNFRRLLILALAAALSMAFFFLSRLENFDIYENVKLLTAGDRYYGDLVSKLRGMSFEDIGAALDDESEVLGYYGFIVDGMGSFLTQEQIDAAKAGVESRTYLPDLQAMDPEDASFFINLALRKIDDAREELKYIQSYPEYLSAIQEQAQRQTQTSVFGDENTFVYRNIMRTAEEFRAMEGVEAVFCANRGIEDWIDFEVADYLYLIILAIFITAFLEERGAGLWGTVRTCRQGRGRLALARIGILAAASALGVVIIYVPNLLISLTSSGAWEDLGLSAQSLPCFKSLPLKITVGQWLGEYFLVKTASGFLVGLLLWCVLGSIANAQFTLGVLGVTLAAEFALFRFLPVQSVLNPLKYFNVFSYVRTSALYTNYLNVNLFGRPFAIRRCALIWLPPLTALFAAWSVLIGTRRRPEGNVDLLSRVTNGFDVLADKLRRRLTTGGWEVYKTLIYQCAVILLALVVLAGSRLFDYFHVNTSTALDPLEEAYRAEMIGPITERTDKYLEIARIKAGDSAEQLGALDRVEAYVASQRQRGEEGGFEPWVFGNFDIYYEGIFGPSGEGLQRMRAAEAMLFLIILCAAMPAFEREAEVVPLLRSLKRGRLGVPARKLVLTFFFTLAVFFTVYLREWRYFIQFMDQSSMLSTLLAPAANSGVLTRFPANFTMWQYLAAVYVCRFLTLYLFAGAVIFLGDRTRTAEGSYLVNFVLLGLPAVLYALGFEFMGYVSPALAVSTVSSGLWFLGQTGSPLRLIPLFVWCVLGAAALALYLRAWAGSHAKRKGTQHDVKLTRTNGIL